MPGLQLTPHSPGDSLLPQGSQKQPFRESPALELSGVCTSKKKKKKDAELYWLQKVGQGALTLMKWEEKCAAAAGVGIGREQHQRAGS